MVYKLRKLYSIICLVHDCLQFTLYLVIVTGRGVRDKTASSSGIYTHGFGGVKNASSCSVV